MIDLRLGDCLDVASGLPSLVEGSVDVVITDPPFDARTHRAAVERKKRPPGARSIDAPLPFPPLDTEARWATAGHLVRVAKRWILLFAADRQVEQWAQALESAGARFVRTGLALPETTAPPEPPPASTPPLTVRQLCERFLAEYSSPRIKDMKVYRSQAKSCMSDGSSPRSPIASQRRSGSRTWSGSAMRSLRAGTRGAPSRKRSPCSRACSPGESSWGWSPAPTP
jgi:hypothetical protein